VPVFEDVSLMRFHLEVLGRPGDHNDGFLNVGVDGLPNFGPGKRFSFKNSSIPLFPYVPHEESWKGFPCFV
jgi:hypothetical protein